MERVKCDNGCLDDVEVEDNCACSKVQQPPPSLETSIILMSSP